MPITFGFMSADDKKKLTNIESGATKNTAGTNVSITANTGAINVATATTSTLGVASFGTGLSINNGNVTVAAATSSVIGGVKIGTNIQNSSGTISVNTATTDTLGLVKAGTNINISSGTISVPQFSSTVAGVVPKSDNSTTKYLRADGSWQVPPDNDTTYNAVTTTTNGLMTAADKVILDAVPNTYVSSTREDADGLAFLNGSNSVIGKIYMMEPTPYPELLYMKDTSVSVMRNGSIIDTTNLYDIIVNTRAGNAASTYNIGDAFSINMDAFTLKRSYNTTTYNIAAHTIYATIIGIDHNSTREGTNKIHLQLGQLANGTKVCYACNDMNATNTNVGGWESSKMRTDSGHLPAILAAMPQAWQDVIVAIPKWTDNVGNKNTADNLTSTEDKLWLLSCLEVFSSYSPVNSNESKYVNRYAYYANNDSDSFRIRYSYDAGSLGGTSAYWWWLRSPIDVVGYFCGVGSGGCAGSYGVGSDIGVSPGFAIG